MYTSRSRAFSQEFKSQAMMAINTAIQEFKEATSEEFGKMAQLDYGYGDIQDHGSRWKDAEQCFQAMVMRFERRMIEERGPGMMTDEEAKKIENMHLANPYLFALSATQGVIGAATCDHYYQFEKLWD
jgi:uncharacterized ferritin-like protein (DUF455 family)